MGNILVHVVWSFLDILIGFYFFFSREPCQIRAMCVMFPVFPHFYFKEVARPLIFLPYVFFFFFQSVKEKLMNVDHSTYFWKSKVMEQPLLGVCDWIIKGKEAWGVGDFSPIWEEDGVWDLCVMQMWDPSPSCTQKSVWSKVIGFTLGLGVPAPGDFPCLSLALFSAYSMVLQAGYQQWTGMEWR